MKIGLMLLIMGISQGLFADPLAALTVGEGQDCKISKCDKGMICRELRVLNGTVFRCMKKVTSDEKKPYPWYHQ